MIIRSIELSDFRNYETLSLSLDQGTNILYGDNAQGKTNLLEAIYLSCTTKSHKGAKDAELIRFRAKEAHVRAETDKDGLTMRVDMHLRPAKAKGVAIDGQKMKRASDFLKRLSARVIVFSPEDLSIIKGAPAGRRRFLDMELCQSDHDYMAALSGYQKQLSQRAALLRACRDGDADEALLDVYDQSLVDYGKKIMFARAQFLGELALLAAQTHLRLTGGAEELTLRYEPDCAIDVYEEEMRLNRKKDVLTAQTNAGPHRDDVAFLIKTKAQETAGVDVRKYGSQGQQRTTALSLKLSEIALVKQQGKTTPILLLDDVLSELDDKRQNDLLSTIGGAQTVITCTGLDEFIGSRFTIDKLFKVADGNVTAEN